MNVSRLCALAALVVCLSSWAARPTITANSGTGSDTAASGCGHTAITAGGNDGAAVVDATPTTVDLSADAPDLSAVAADASSGTWCLWVGTSSGRQFSRITAADNTTKIVTVATAYSTSQTGKTWGIGGKRATWTAALFTDAQPGWTISTETDQSQSASFTTGVAGDLTTGPITVQGDSASSLRTITQTANAANVSVDDGDNRWRFRNLKLANSNATKTSARGIYVNGANVEAVNCVFGDTTNKLLSAVARAGGTVHAMLVSCEVSTTTSHGIALTGSSSFVMLVDCYVHDCGADGVNQSDSSNIYAIRSVFARNADDGIESPFVAGLIDSCVFDANTDDGLVTTVNPTGYICITNNIFSNHSGAGDQGTTFISTLPLHAPVYIDYNCLYNNASADANCPAQSHASTADPGYADASGGNFSTGSAMGSIGGPVGSSGYLGLNSTTPVYQDIGAAQRSPTADEASRNTDPGIANVKSGTTYKIQAVDKTGTYSGGGGGTRAYAGGF